MDNLKVNINEESQLPDNAICEPQLKSIILRVLKPQMRAVHNIDPSFSKYLLLQVTDIRFDVSGPKAHDEKWENRAMEIKSDASFSPTPLSVVQFRKEYKLNS